MNRLGGDQRGGGPFRLNVAKVRVPLSAVLAAWAGRKAAEGVGWLARHPVVLLPVLLVWLAAKVVGGLGAWPLLVAAVLVIGGLLVWRRVRPESFTRQVVWRLRGAVRGRFVYRFAWQPAMVTTGLAVRVDAREYLPKVRSVRSTGGVDQLRVRMLPGRPLRTGPPQHHGWRRPSTPRSAASGPSRGRGASWCCGSWSTSRSPAWSTPLLLGLGRWTWRGCRSRGVRTA